MKKVYVESSVISYLTAKPSRDLIVSARQALTLEWWESKSKNMTFTYQTLFFKRYP